MKQIKKRQLCTALAAAMGASMTLSLPAEAQQLAQSKERIEVTGSNIKRVDTETADPSQSSAAKRSSAPARQKIDDPRQAVRREPRRHWTAPVRATASRRAPPPSRLRGLGPSARWCC